ncbi:MAG: polyisoprenoid-binding protein [Rhodothermales bacterium]|nr:polyisoprenoid-binding protein [Rhodothermales bacterium]MBO6779520.1 polyisoprenoid-binding protein [Rhodothermales bacterium]
MSKALLMAVAATVAIAGAVETYQIDAAHSNIGFKVRHLGITNVNGSFTDYEATATVDPADLSTLKAEAVIQTGSVDTGIERRDNHLRSDDFFNAEAFPTMTFTSKEVRNLDGGEFELVGDLTIRDVTKEIVLDVEYLGSATMRGNQVLGFEARGSISRFDYGLKWDALTEAGGLIVAEDVRLILELEATAQ